MHMTFIMMNIGTKTVQAVHQTSLFSHLVKSSLDSRLDANHHILSFYFLLHAAIEKVFQANYQAYCIRVELQFVNLILLHT